MDRRLACAPRIAAPIALLSSYARTLCVQDTYKDRWLACARRVFAELDVDGSGELSAAEIASAFSSHLAPCECFACGAEAGA